MPVNVPSAPSAASEQPRIQRFQLDASSVGDIARSVNLFRGDVNIPLTLVALDGRNGLWLQVTAFYGSNVARETQTWNAAMPTSIAGLGWSIPVNRIFVDAKTTGEANDGVYFIQWQGSVDRLIWCGEADGEVLFQSREHPLWVVRYRSSSSEWRVLMENGIEARFGGDGGSGGTILHGVRWNNWIGSTLATKPTPQQYEVAWNLSRLVSPWGDGLTCTYDNDEPVVTTGVTYTRASYQKTMEDMLGNRIVFNYAEKERYEYVPPHTLPDGAPNPAYQDRYETRYLTSLDVFAPGVDDVEFSIVFTYVLANASGQAGELFIKRYLTSVSQQDRGVQALPPLSFTYELDPSRSNPGGLSAVTFPEGGRITYGYETVELNRDESNPIFRRNITVPNPILGSQPLVFHGPGYLVVAWYSKTEVRTKLQIYSFAGRWSDPWSMEFAGLLDLSGLRAAVQDTFFALFLARSDLNQGTLLVFRRTDYRFGEWNVWELIRTTLTAEAAEETALSAGNDFILLHAGDETAVNRWTWDRIRGEWEHDRREAGTPKIAFAAQLNSYIVAYYSEQAQSASYQLFHRNLAGQWLAAPKGASGERFPWRSSYGTRFWSVSTPNYAIGTYSSSGGQQKLRFLMWDAAFDTTLDLVVAGSSAPTDATGSTVASGNRLFRFDGSRWIDVTVATTADALYASGDDVALVTRPSGTGTSNTLARYIAGAATWQLTTIASAPDSQAILGARRRKRRLAERALQRNLFLAEPSVFAPTISGDWMTLGHEIRRRSSDGTWVVVGTLPSNANRATLQNRGPEYLLFEEQASDPAAVSTVAYLLQNGTIARTMRFEKQRILTGNEITDAPTLAGGRSFVTYPAGQSITSPTEIQLHRILNHELSDRQFDAVAASVTIDNGYETTSMRYAYDTTTAVFDASGELVQYPRVMQTWLDSAGLATGGRSESEFFNGLPDPALGEASAYYSLAAGYVKQVRNFDAGGIEIEAVANEWKGVELLSGDESPLGILVPAAQLVLARSAAHTAAALFPLPSSDAAEFDKGIIPDSARATFAARGLPLAADATVEATSEAAWVITTGSREYGVHAREADLIVLGRLTRSNQYDYDSATAMMVASRTTDFTSKGTAETVETTNLYAWRVSGYAGLKDARMLTAIAEARATNSTAQVTVSAAAATYRSEWGARTVWAASQAYVWRGPSSIAPPFDFAADAQNPEYLLQAAVLTRNEQGQPVTAREVLGPTNSTIYDTSGYYAVASVGNADLGAAREVGVLGFESYESLAGWSAGTTPLSSLITDEQSHTGDRSLALPGGGPDVSSRFSTAGEKQRYLFAVWMKTAAGFPSGARWTITVEGGQTYLVELTDTAGVWKQFWQVVELPAEEEVEVTVTLINPTPAVLYADDVRFTPLACDLSVQVFDSESFIVTATLDESGATGRFVSDQFGRLIGTIGPGDQVTALTATYYSRDGHGGSFDGRDPNGALTIAPAEGGLLDDFRDANWQARWSASDPSHWTVENDALVHTTSTPDRVTLRGSEDFSDYGIRLELDFPLGMPITEPLGVRIGNVTVQWVPQGEWQLLENGQVVDRFSQPVFGPGSWIVIAGRRGVLFFSNSRQILGHWLTGEVGGALELFTATGGVAFGQIFVYHAPRVSVSYNDGTGSERQQQALGAEGTIVSGSLYDQLNRPSITTKRMRYDAAVPGYRTSFVTGIDWTTGVMTGDLADYYSGGERSNDEGYPYQRNRLAASPSAVVLESGSPGATLAIRPGNAHTVRNEYLANTHDGFLEQLPAGEYPLTRTTDPNGLAEESISDTAGNLVGSRMQSGNDKAVVAYEYDARGHLRRTLPPNYFAPPAGARPDDFIVTEETDVLGNVLSSYTSDTHTTQFIYDDANRLRFTLTADGVGKGSGGTDRVLYTCYDVLGRIREQGSVDVKWDRAELTRRANTSWPANEAPGWQTRFEYDGDGTSINAAGRLFRTTQKDGGATVQQTLVYDAFGNVIRSEEAQPDETYDVSYAYNVAADRLAVVYPRQKGEVRYTFDSLGQIVAVGDASERGRWAEYAYEASGSFGTVTRNPLGAMPVVRRFRYNSPGWPLAVESDAFTERLGYWEESGYEGSRYYNGQPARVTSRFDGGTPEFAWLNAYDGISRLATAENTLSDDYSIGAGDEPLLYDGNGNVLSFRDGTTPRAYEYVEGTNKVERVDDQPAFAYDLDGAATSGGGASSISYDEVTGLTRSVTLADGRKLTIDYAPGAIRRRKVFTDGTTVVSEIRYYSGIPGGPLVETTRTASGAPRDITYVWGPDGLVVIRSETVEGYVLADRLRSTRMVIGPGGELIAGFNFRPYGGFMGTPAGSQPDLIRYLFTGAELDPETRLYNLNARLYSPSLFRFYRPDPAGQYFGPYVYAGDDPFTAIDPSGELAFLVGLLISVAVGTLVGAVVGGAGYAIQTAVTGREFKLKEFGIAIGIGAAAGAVGGAVGFGAGAAVAGVLSAAGVTGASLAGGIIGGAVSGAVSGAAGGVASQVVANAISGAPLDEGLGQAALIGAAAGALTGGIGGGIGAQTARGAARAASRASRGSISRASETESLIIRRPLTPDVAANRIRTAYRLHLRERQNALRENLRMNTNKVSGRLATDENPLRTNQLYWRGADRDHVTTYMAYNSRGGPLNRVDITGATHGGVPTPHTLKFTRIVRTNPRTGQQFTNYATPPKNAVVPARWWEIP